MTPGWAFLISVAPATAFGVFAVWRRLTYGPPVPEDPPRRRRRGLGDSGGGGE